MLVMESRPKIHLKKWRTVEQQSAFPMSEAFGPENGGESGTEFHPAKTRTHSAHVSLE